MKRLCIVLCFSIFFFPAIPAHAQDAVSDLLGRINELRASLGLHGYALNGTLSAAAQNQASWMVGTGLVSHIQSDGSTPRTRAAAAGYGSSTVSENIYMGTNASAGTAWQWWVNSAIHYRGITNAAYTEVGIGAAAGEHGTAYVLVFGNPAGWQIPARSISSASSGAAGQPSFVVGVDNLGNIMHEIQPGDTLGDIALIYGYTWDDLEYIRSINHMTEPEGRLLDIGAVLLVPPWDGTYTPTPGDPEPPPNATEPAPQDVIVVAAQSTEVVEAMPTLSPTSTPTPLPEDPATLDNVPEWVMQTVVPPQSSWTAATMTPTSTTVLLVANVTEVADNSVLIDPTAAEVVVSQVEINGRDEETSPLLFVAIGLQIILLGIAGFEFLRRR